MRPLKSCDGEHQITDACATCAEDNALCDLCWEQNDPWNIALIASPAHVIAIENPLTHEDTKYVVCLEHYRAHRRRVELELI